MGKRLSKIYTRTGDDGTTGLGDGTRVPKDSLRVDAFGTVDEANSAIGVVLANDSVPENIRSALTEVQHDLFELGGELCIPGHSAITEDFITRLENELDALNADLPALKACVNTPLMYDESLVTMDDANRLIEQKVADAFNIRISKCGGLLPSLRLAHLAHKHGVTIQLGCMVGETSILSAAGRRFLEMAPGVRFAEGWHGTLLISNDVVRKSLRFGYGGRGRALGPYGLGIVVERARLESLCLDRPIVLEL